MPVKKLFIKAILSAPSSENVEINTQFVSCALSFNTTMDELLQNPVWNALLTGNRHLAQGDGDIRFFPGDIAPFVGMKAVTPENYAHLYELLPFGRVVAVVAPFETAIPEQWKVVKRMPGFQMVYKGDTLAGGGSSRGELIPLTEQDVPAMIELTALTQPGPFFSRTIAFGSYFGIFSDKKLMAMAGYRIAVGKFREISAVCTHPDHLGKGYASLLIRHLMGTIIGQGEWPILHVVQHNIGAIRLYEKIGFRVAREMRFDMITKK
jgi:ribosomal protein S18 acetylase RimI-like enzyme